MTATRARSSTAVSPGPISSAARVGFQEPSATLTDRIRLAIVNDYEVVVEGLAAMMRHHLDRVEIVELDATGGGPSDVSHSAPIDVALLDTFAHRDEGGAIIAELLGRANVSNVVVYSWAVGEELVARSLARGATGYLSKSLPATEIVDALRRVRDGETVVNRAAPRTAAPVAGDWPGREESLTPRESEVLALITRGLSNDQIATTTKLSPNSVKSYIRGAYRKIGVASRTQAVLWALDHGFSIERD